MGEIGAGPRETNKKPASVAYLGTSCSPGHELFIHHETPLAVVLQMTNDSRLHFLTIFSLVVLSYEVLFNEKFKQGH